MPRKRLPPRVYYREDEGQWVIRDGSKMRRLGLRDPEADYAAALERLSNYIAEHQTGARRGPARPADITIGEILAAYIDQKASEVASQRTLFWSAKNLSAFWADLTADQANGPAVRRYQKDRAVKSGTVRREIAVLNAALRWAFQEGLVSGLIVLPRPPDGPPRDRALTRSELAEVLWHMRSPRRRHAARAMLIWVYTGTRATPALRLRWTPSLDSGWVDCKGGVLHRRGAHEVETKKRRGSVRMPNQLAVLADIWRRADMARAAQGGHAAEWVCGYRGSPPTSIKTVLAGAIRDVNAVRLSRGEQPLEPFTPHVLKHTAVTWAFQRGMSLDDAVDFFSTSRETLERVYRRYSPEYQNRAAEIMSQRR